MYTFRKIDPSNEKDRKAIWDFVAEVTKKYGKTDMPEHVQNYIEKGWLGYGVFVPAGLIGWCFIKRPQEHPETTTVILEKYRGEGLSYNIRNYAIDHALSYGMLEGDTIYSGTHKDNIASLVSILHSGFKIVSMNADGFINLEKKI